MTCALALFATSHPVSAQQRYAKCTTAPSAQDLSAAKGMHAAGTAYHDKGEYAKAIEAWVSALQFACNAPKFLLNIGMAYEKLGKTKEAIHAYETYIERVGKKAASTQAAKVENLKKMMNQKPAPAASSPKASGDVAPQKPSATAGGSEASEKQPNKASKLPLGPILVGSGGLLLAGTGAALLGVGMGKTATAEKNCPTRQQCSDADAALGNDGRTFTTIGGVSLGIGLAAMAGGVTWFLMGRSADEQAPTSGWVLAPNVTTSPSGRPTLQGFSLAGHF